MVPQEPEQTLDILRADECEEKEVFVSFGEPSPLFGPIRTRDPVVGRVSCSHDTLGPLVRNAMPDDTLQIRNRASGRGSFALHGKFIGPVLGPLPSLIDDLGPLELPLGVFGAPIALGNEEAVLSIEQVVVGWLRVSLFCDGAVAAHLP